MWGARVFAGWGVCPAVACQLPRGGGGRSACGRIEAGCAAGSWIAGGCSGGSCASSARAAGPGGPATSWIGVKGCGVGVACLRRLNRSCGRAEAVLGCWATSLAAGPTGRMAGTAAPTRPPIRATSALVPCGSILTSSRHHRHLRTHPRVGVPQLRHRPGGAEASSRRAIGPRIAPKASQGRAGRSRCLAMRAATRPKPPIHATIRTGSTGSFSRRTPMGSVCPKLSGNKVGGDHSRLQRSAH